MENPWLTVTLASPLNPSTSVGNLSHAPPLPDPPDPPDPLQFPPLPSPLSGGQKPPKRRSFSRPSPKSTVPAPLLSTASVAAVNGSFAGAATPPSLPTLSTAQLLATFTSLPPCHVSNPRSGLSTVNHESQIPLSGPQDWTLVNRKNTPLPPMPLHLPLLLQFLPHHLTTPLSRLLLPLLSVLTRPRLPLLYPSLSPLPLAPPPQKRKPLTNLLWR
ncbi:BnaCnng06620D [Brassica napus]|uniref:BnaCnng06620D protein n=1 Tax=Brassica napus TaxID=3708 RepID=A0A078H5R8_BRANA|nr:BnaCnng06620D [Brassica napus]